VTGITLRAGTIVAETGDVRDASLSIQGSRISVIEEAASASVMDLGDVTIIPGLIDIHIHGREAHDVMDADPVALSHISRSLTRHGVTGFLATTVTSSWIRTLDALRVIGEVDGDALPGARMLGAYSEGSFFNARQKGAHNEAFFIKPSPELIDEMWQATRGKLKVLALAPEVEGAMETLRHAKALGIKVVLGHTDASYDQARAALVAGASGGVHVFNGMRGIHHREPGCAGAVLLEAGTVEVIADGVHLHPAILSLITRLKTPSEILLISDCMCAGGLDDGAYRLGEMDVVVESGIVRTEAGSLAGSTLTLDKAVARMASDAPVPLRDAVHMASLSPARFLGAEQDIGSIAVGKLADLAVLDHHQTVRATIIGGRLVYLDPDWPLASKLQDAFGPENWGNAAAPAVGDGA
jgi:N-acetylgalactosamine-6-phosphate deacetylase